MFKKFFLIVLFIFITSTVYSQNRRVVTYQVISSENILIDLEAYINEAVDIQPSFPGGNSELMRYINKERHYPEEAYKAGIEGRVVCSFIINTEGEITNIQVIKGVEKSLNDEAVRIISKMPKWEAGVINGITVPVYFILPIPFRR